MAFSFFCHSFSRSYLFSVGNGENRVKTARQNGKIQLQHCIKRGEKKRHSHIYKNQYQKFTFSLLFERHQAKHQFIGMKCKAKSWRFFDLDFQLGHNMPNDTTRYHRLSGFENDSGEKCTT